MRPLYSSKGILISKIKFKETSYILKIFTEKFGLISVMVHGARKSNSRFLGYFNLMNELYFDLIKSNNSEIYLLKEVDFIRFFLKDIRYTDQPYFYIVSELIRKFYNDEYEEIYKLIVQYFELLNQNKMKKIFLFWRFLAKLLMILGNPIIYDRCSICGDKLGGESFFSSKGEGFICQKCSRLKMHKIQISQEVNLIFRNFMSLGKLELSISERSIQEINRIFLIHLTAHFHADFDLSLLSELR